MKSSGVSCIAFRKRSRPTPVNDMNQEWFDTINATFVARVCSFFLRVVALDVDVLTPASALQCSLKFLN